MFTLVFLALVTMNVHGSSFAYLTNVPSYECTIACYVLDEKKGFLYYENVQLTGSPYL